MLGIAAGLALWLAVSRAIASLLFGIAPNDPSTIALAALAVTAATLLASWVPARRAVRADAVAVLRE
jgi:ABC-type antimicrobial peptide transport system permease subunit